ncbi:MAG: hypothetical protein II767_08700 [Proteobacteria bacterium]|nr:hypothetical protein [Pseudomonadota bacterium]MBQ4360321.1 hypothetical protein [Pseudomonadota bacterium]
MIKHGLSFSLISLCTLGLMMSACSNSQKETETAADGHVVYTDVESCSRFDNSEMRVQVFDMDRDGHVDLWKFYSNKQAADEDTGEYVISRKELDLNSDKRVDRIMFYNQKENLIREEVDSNFDGDIDWAHIYDNGILIRTEFYSIDCNRKALDSDTSSLKPNLVRVFRKGVLTREDLDPHCDGIIDRVTIFNVDGDIAQIGVDDNNDGVIDEWVRY